MIKRLATKNISTIFKQFPAVALLGPRQVGKTTLAKEIAANSKKESLYIDLEKKSDRNKLTDAELFFAENRNKLIILDEIQQMPELFTILRPEIDEHRKPGRFLITGSASPELVKNVSESLAGRIAYCELTPINLPELSNTKFKVKNHWYRGGFPEALNAKNNTAFSNWAENFIRSYIERDLAKLFGVSLNSVIVQNLWSMLAINHGGIWNSEMYARSLGITGPTVNRYVDFMEGAFLLRILAPWYINANKRMVKSPKIYIRDTGILHHMAAVESYDKLPGHPIVGASWEGYVIEEICRQLPFGIKPYFYRTHHGAEVDLLLVKGIKPICAIEIKFSSSPSISKGFYEVLTDLNLESGFVIVPDEKTYKLSEKAIIVGLEGFLNKYLPKIIST
jgi:uncharacterized protein